MDQFNPEVVILDNKITEEAKTVLYNYDWYGNTRELRNVIERIIILENEEILELYHLPDEVVQFSKDNNLQSTNALSGFSIDIPKEGLSMGAVERDLVEKALRITNSNQTKASKLLDITRDSLRYKMKKFGLL